MAGSFWQNFEHVADLIAPVAFALIPGIPPAIAQAATSAIKTAEGIPGADGPTKKAYVIAEVKNGIDITNAILKGQGKNPLADATTLTNAVSAGTDAVIASINAIKDAHVAAGIPDVPLAPMAVAVPAATTQPPSTPSTGA